MISVQNLAQPCTSSSGSGGKTNASKLNQQLEQIEEEKHNSLLVSRQLPEDIVLISMKDVEVENLEEEKSPLNRELLLEQLGDSDQTLVVPRPQPLPRQATRHSKSNQILVNIDKVDTFSSVEKGTKESQAES